MQSFARLFTIILVFFLFGCDYFPRPPLAAPSEQDLVAAKNGLEDALARRIQSEGGAPQEIRIESSTRDAQKSDQVWVTYRLLYTLPAQPSPLWVHYRGQSLLKGNPATSGDLPWEWHVVENQQLDYSIDFQGTTAPTRL